jgi:hypothetical protein
MASQNSLTAPEPPLDDVNKSVQDFYTSVDLQALASGQIPADSDSEATGGEEESGSEEDAQSPTAQAKTKTGQAAPATGTTVGGLYGSKSFLINIKETFALATPFSSSSPVASESESAGICPLARAWRSTLV